MINFKRWNFSSRYSITSSRSSDLKSLLMSSSLAYFCLDSEGNLLECNKILQNIFNKKESQIINKSFMHLFDSFEFIHGKNVLVHLLRQKSLANYYIETIDYKGNKRSHIISAHHNIEDNGDKTIEGFINDLSYKNQLEKRVNEQANFQQYLSDGLREVVIVFDCNGISNFVNSSAKKILNLKDQSLDIKDFSKIILNDDGSEVELAIIPPLMTLENGISYSDVIFKVNNEESDTWISCSSKPLFSDETTKISGVVCYFFDVTGYKNIEKKMVERQWEINRTIHEKTRTLEIQNEQLQKKLMEKQNQEQHLKRIASIVATTDEAIIVVNNEYEILDWNSGAERLFGYSAKEILGCSYFMLIPEDDLFGKETIFEEVKNTKLHGREVKAVRIHKNGKHVNVSLAIAPLFDDEGEVYGLSIVMNDIEELTQALQTVEDEKTDLEQVAYATSHDLKEPVRNMKIYLELIQLEFSKSITNEMKAWMKHVMDGLESIQAMIEGVSNFNKRNSLSVESVDCNQVMETVTTQLQATIIEKNASIFYDQLPTISITKGHILHIFQNLISNALKFSQEDRTPVIAVGYIENKQNWIFSVEDNGLGISKVHQKNIFKLFNRVHRNISGSGLGLAIAERFIKKYGGKMWVESIEGEGSKFYFSIPKNT